MLEISPNQIELRGVKIGKVISLPVCSFTVQPTRRSTFDHSRTLQVYVKVLTVINQLSTTVEASIRAGSADRWSVHPFKLRLKPKQSCEVEVKLKVVKFAQIDKAVIQGQRDTFHIKTQLSDQQFHATFFLDRSLGSNETQRHPPDDKPAELDPLGGGDQVHGRSGRPQGNRSGRAAEKQDWEDKVRLYRTLVDPEFAGGRHQFADRGSETNWAPSASI